MSDLSISLEALRSDSPRSQLSVTTLFRRGVFRREMRADLPARAALPGPRAGGARGRRLLRAAAGRRRPRAGAHARTACELLSNVCRHRQALMLRGRGRHAAATSSARCTAGPTTCRASCSARRTSQHDPCLNLNNYPLQHWNGLVFEDNGRDVARRPGQPAAPRADARLQRLRARPGATCTSATTTGRPSSRSTWRTTTSAPSIPGWAASSPATTCAGSSASTTRCRRWACNDALRAARLAGLPALARGGAGATAAASRPSTARSG